MTHVRGEDFLFKGKNVAIKVYRGKRNVTVFMLAEPFKLNSIAKTINIDPDLYDYIYDLVEDWHVHDYGYDNVIDKCKYIDDYVLWSDEKILNLYCRNNKSSNKNA